MKRFKKKTKRNIITGEVYTKDFLDTIAPSIIKFHTDHFICGNTYRSVWAIREYPTSTEELALLRYLGEKENITLKIYSTVVTPLEEKKIISNGKREISTGY